MLWVAVKAEPTVFTVSVLASALYAAMTVATAQVLGWVTQDVMLPAFRSGHTTAGALSGAAAAIVGVALFKALGVAGRRFYAGLMQYRMQARYRREVTRQYLRLPLAWHHRHPTGQLLSNANADVEAAWAPIAPLPMAVGVVVMLLIAAVSILLTDTVVAIVGFLVFPAIALLNVVYQRRLSPVATRAQRLRAEVSEVAHESFEGGLVVKTLGREESETERFRAGAEALRDANVAVGRIRGLFDPVLEALPNLGVLAVLLIGSARLQSGAMTAGDLVHVAYLFTLLAWPIRALGWVLAEVPRSVVGWERVRGVLDAGGSMPFGGRALDEDKAAALEVRRVRFGYEADGDGADEDLGTEATGEGRAQGRQVLRDVSFTAAPGRTIALVGPTGSGKSTLTSLLVRLVDPSDGSVLLDGLDVRDVRQGAWPRPPRWSPSRRSCSTTPSGTMWRSASTCRTSGSGRRCGSPRPMGSWRPWPTGSTPGSASAARPSRAGSGSGSRWRAPWSGGPGCWSWTTPPPASIRRWRRGSCKASGRRRPPRAAAAPP